VNNGCITCIPLLAHTPDAWQHGELHDAVWNRRPELIRVMLAQGAPVDGLQYGQTAEQMARDRLRRDKWSDERVRQVEENLAVLHERR
jgi:hypothetical protein